MDRLRKLEDKLVEAETRIMLVLVLVMLSLAAYNVFYRNLLVPLQKHWATSGPPIAMMEPTAAPSTDDAAPDASPDPDAEGFGGGFGEGGDAAAAEPAAEEAEGFGGGFDTAGDAKAGVEAAPPAEAAPAQEADGFGGGFDTAGDANAGKEDGDAKAADADGGFGGGFGGGFDGDGPSAEEAAAAAELDALVAEQSPDFADIEDLGPQGGPPPKGSFAAWGISAIDAIKLDWIDIFLRQLVILVSFLGAMLATRRRKHINIDAVSKILPLHIQRIVTLVLNVVSVGICLVLASAGSDLVKLGLEYPKDLLPWAQEWVFQLMFPVGFGVLALHFTVRVLESAAEVKNPPAAPSGEEVAK